VVNCEMNNMYGFGDNFGPLISPNQNSPLNQINDLSHVWITLNDLSVGFIVRFMVLISVWFIVLISGCT